MSIGIYGALNVVLHPHPDGAYRELFERAGASQQAQKYFGDRFARLSPISETRNGAFSGRLTTWTEIDPKSNSIQTETLVESPLSDTDFTLPRNIGFNAKVFSFAFREEDHTLFVELLNDERQSISINSAKKAFFNILSNSLLNENEEFDIHQKKKSNAVEQVLNIKHLRKIEILLDLPNPDALPEDKKRLIDKINEIHAKRYKAELTIKAGTDTLVLR